jgi:CBS-domain-containing membrane protein
MTPDPVTAPDWITVSDFIARFASVHRATAYPLHDFSGQLSGLVSLQDVAQVSPQSQLSTQLRAIAQPLTQVAIARPEDALTDVLHQSGDSRASYILVKDGDRLVGMASPEDIRRALDLAAVRRQGSAPVTSG